MTALESGLNYRQQVERLSALLDQANADRDYWSQESRQLADAVQSLRTRLDDEEIARKSAESLLAHIAEAMFATLRSGQHFDNTYTHFRKKCHKLKREHDRLFQDAVSFQVL